MDDLQAAMLDLLREAHESGSQFPEPGSRFPWYDGHWLGHYVQAKDYLATSDSPKLHEFIEATSALRIQPGSFAPIIVDQFFDEDTMAQIRFEIASQEASALEKDEVITFGRDVIHDNKLFAELQSQAVDRVSEMVGQELEASYTFLSLYGPDGHCSPHMDAPEAMWTLDICIDQSRPWPIYISDVVDWPEEWAADDDQDWEQRVKEQQVFHSYEMRPGQALLFGGSSQWHYRDPMNAASNADYCNLLFLHFIPKGACDIVDYRQWPERFDIPEISSWGDG